MLRGCGARVADRERAEVRGFPASKNKTAGKRPAMTPGVSTPPELASLRRRWCRRRIAGAGIAADQSPAGRDRSAGKIDDPIDRVAGRIHSRSGEYRNGGKYVGGDREFVLGS